MASMPQDTSEVVYHFNGGPVWSSSIHGGISSYGIPSSLRFGRKLPSCTPTRAQSRIVSIQRSATDSGSDHIPTVMYGHSQGSLPNEINRSAQYAREAGTCWLSPQP